MNRYSPEYNKQHTRFTEGIALIRRKNNYVFDNLDNKGAAYDRKDIRSYFTIEEDFNDGNSISFRPGSGLPDSIRKEILDLFYATWPAKAEISATSDAAPSDIDNTVQDTTGV